MPYIKQEERDRLQWLVDQINNTNIDSEGVLNYLITATCQAYARKQPRFGYNVANAIVGALECAKQEYYRRIAAPYEDMKKESNGDVY
jgi:hypothetical protein